MQFDEVRAEHFSSISRNPFPHQLIDKTLLELGGGSENAPQLRKDILAAAGWPHNALVVFGKYPDQACKAFNAIRAALAETQDPKALIAKLKESQPKSK